MKLNNKEFRTVVEAMNYAEEVANRMRENYYIPFSMDDAIMETSAGVISHIWMHKNVGGVYFRLSFTENEVGVYAWSDGRGWKKTDFNCDYIS